MPDNLLNTSNAQAERRTQARGQLLHLRQEAARALGQLRRAYQRELDAIKDDGAEAHDLTPYYASIRRSIKAAEQELKQMAMLHDHVKYIAIPETFARDRIKTFTSINGDRITVTTDTLASVLKEDRATAYGWLRDNNHGDIIEEYIQPGTLSGFVKVWMEEMGREIPPETKIKVAIRPRANLTPGNSDEQQGG